MLVFNDLLTDLKSKLKDLSISVQLAENSKTKVCLEEELSHYTIYKKNALDILRIIVLPKALTDSSNNNDNNSSNPMELLLKKLKAGLTGEEEEINPFDEQFFWVKIDPNAANHGNGNSFNESDDEEGGNNGNNSNGFHESLDGNDNDELVHKLTKGKKTKKSLLGKRKNDDDNDGSNKKLKKTIPYSQKLFQYKYYQKYYSKNWILLLSLSPTSLPWSLKEHKLLLNHLSTYVIKELSNPLLLADYLTECYNFGGIISILALESLFHLIVYYNLDYPSFFQSMYRLCNMSILQSKYAYKYLELLSMTLSSSNIPEQILLSFIKRLVYCALHLSSNKIFFCINQVIWLFRTYHSSQVLIHRKQSKKTITNTNGTIEGTTEQDKKAGKKAKKQKAGESNEVEAANTSASVRDYIVEDEGDELLADNNANFSSLHEITLLEKHYYPKLAKLAESLRQVETTSIGSVPVNVKESSNILLTDMIEEEFNEAKKSNYKKNCALAFMPPKQLFPQFTA